jgi:hypothetical protein
MGKWVDISLFLLGLGEFKQNDTDKADDTPSVRYAPLLEICLLCSHCPSAGHFMTFKIDD